MPARLYCPSCRLRFHSFDGRSPVDRCPRCQTTTALTAFDANSWLASMVAAELRAGRGDRGRAPPPDKRGASSAARAAR